MISIGNLKLSKEVSKMIQLNIVHYIIVSFVFYTVKLILPSGRLAKHKTRANWNENSFCDFRQV